MLHWNSGRKKPVIGSRITAEKCDDASSIREVMSKELTNRIKLGQLRRIRANCWGNYMRKSLVGLMMLGMALTGTANAGDEDKVKPAEEPSAAEAGKEKQFKPPPGFRQRKRGEFVVYCRKQPVMGTRLPAEVCYDEEGIKAMLAAQRDDRDKMDQMRRICAGDASCGGI